MSGPERIGPHPVLRELGRGGMGSVYLATHARLGVPVAIKVTLERDPELVARFQREAEVLAGIRHPNVVDAFEAGVTETGEPYLVMEYVEGRDLAALVRDRGALPPEEAVALGVAIARGLGAAHERGVVHRDLKPENVLLGPMGPKVTDFGLARLRATGEALTASGVILGTPAYMPPEQLNDPRDVDERSDVYALGAILYCLVSGSPPVRGASTVEVMSRACQGLREPWPEGVPQPFREVADCAMAYERADRFSSCELLAGALEELGSQTAALGSSAALVGVALGSVALVSVALVSGGLFVARGGGGASPEASPRASSSASPPQSSAASPLAPILPLTPTPPPSPSATASPASSRVGSPTRGTTPSPVTNEPPWLRVEKRHVALMRGSLEDLRAAAKAGDSIAQRLYGRCCWIGFKGVEPDPQAAIRWLRASAEQGDPEGQAELGAVLLTQPEPVSREAIPWLERAQAQGSARAWLLLAKSGGGRADAEQERLRLEARWEAGDANAGYYIGLIFALQGRAPQRARLWLDDAALRGSRLAMSQLGGQLSLHEDRRIRSTAIRYLRQAVPLGEGYALFGYGRLLVRGDPAFKIAKDVAKGRQYLEMADRGCIVGASSELGALASSRREAIERFYVDHARGHPSALFFCVQAALDFPAEKALPRGLTDAALLALVDEAIGRASAPTPFLLRAGIALQRGTSRLGKQEARAAKCFEVASARGSAPAKQALGHAYLYGLGVPQDVARGRKTLEEIARAGNPTVYYILGRAFYIGLPEASRDPEAAERYLTLAVEGGVREAVLLQVTRCEEAKDYARGRTFLELAAKRDPNALAMLGKWTLTGKGGPVDPERAQALFAEAARRKSPLGHLGLGESHELGRIGGAPDLARAREHYELAASGGYSFALYRLAVFLLERGQASERARALELMARAAEKDCLDAYALLAKVYTSGAFGVAPDPAKAKAYRDRLAALKAEGVRSAWPQGDE